MNSKKMADSSQSKPLPMSGTSGISHEEEEEKTTPPIKSTTTQGFKSAPGHQVHLKLEKLTQMYNIKDDVGLTELCYRIMDKRNFLGLNQRLLEAMCVFTRSVSTDALIRYKLTNKFGNMLASSKIPLDKGESIFSNATCLVHILATIVQQLIQLVVSIVGPNVDQLVEECYVIFKHHRLNFDPYKEDGFPEINGWKSCLNNCLIKTLNRISKAVPNEERKGLLEDYLEKN